MCLSMMIVICNKQHLSNIGICVYENVRQHWGLVKKKKSVDYKKACTLWQADTGGVL